MKRGKLFGKISLIDAVAVLTVMLLVIVAVVRFFGFSTSEKAKEKAVEPSAVSVPCQVTLRFNNVTSELLRDPFEQGQAVTIKNKSFGKVLSFEKEPAKQQLTLSDGSIVTVPTQTAYNYIVTVKVTLEKKNGLLYAANGEAIGVGKLITLCTQNFAEKATVIGVEKIQ